MALHSTPEAHEADPPSAWTVSKAGNRVWYLDSSLGGTIDSFTTRRDAEDAKTSGRAVDLYAKEGRWYAGETPAGWRPWADVKAERDQREFRNSDGYRASVAQLAREIGDGALFPAEENFTEGKCSACGYPVRAHQGVSALGRSDEWTTYGVHLHRGCAADVRRAQESAKTAVR